MINTIEDLRKYVNVSNSLQQESIWPFIYAAEVDLLEPIVGYDLLDKIKTSTELKDLTLVDLCKHVVATFALKSYIDEGSIIVSDNGVSVNKNDNFVPASDAKLAKATESLLIRGDKAIARVVAYLEANPDSFPEWESSDYVSLKSSLFIPTRKEFYQVSCIPEIPMFSEWTKIMSSMAMVESSDLLKIVPPVLVDKIRSEAPELTKDERTLRALCCKYIASNALAAITTDEKEITKHRDHASYFDSEIKRFVRSTPEFGVEQLEKFDNSTGKIFVV